VLKSLGVSTPLIDQICLAVRLSGLNIGAKITGGGFGGHVLLVHDEAVAFEAVQALLPSGVLLRWNVQLHEV
jgi:mevalonate kinase